MSDAGETKAEVCVNSDGKSCARKIRKRHLPQDLLFPIFLRLPAQFLHDVTRHVCREWDLVTRDPSFIHSHLRNSTSGIIIQEVFSDQSETYVEMRGGCLEISKFDCGFRGLVWSSCNGLVLAPDCRCFHTLYVINPLTKQRFFLPPYSRCIGNHGHFALAFVDTSMEYKVVHFIEAEPFKARTHIAVLTIGVDKVWRHLDIKHLSLTTRRSSLYGIPIVTGGYVHWLGETFVLTMNVETETICEFPVPRSHERCETFLPMGSSLSLVCGHFPSSREVWEMNPRTGKWIKLLTFDLEPLSHIFKRLFPHLIYLTVPCGWLEVREVLLINCKGFHKPFVAYNIKTGEVQPFELDHKTPFPMQNHIHGSHVKSLVRLER